MMHGQTKIKLRVSLIKGQPANAVRKVMRYLQRDIYEALTYFMGQRCTGVNVNVSCMYSNGCAVNVPYDPSTCF